MTDQEFEQLASNAFDRSVKNPWRTFLKFAGVLLAVAIVFIAVGSISGWFGDAAHVAQKEFGVSALLKKYEYFKDASAALDKKRADIGVYDSRMQAMRTDYGAGRKDWPREDREQYNVWASEVAGVKASYNSLAAEYNANMAKMNYAFCNVGELPQGATTPLPREYKPYIEQ